jgi:hypothetical protein
MPEHVAQQQIDAALGTWDRLAPGLVSGCDIGPGAKRDQCVTGLRDLADLLEARPDIPVPSYNRLTVFAAGAAADKLAQVDHAGRLLGAPVDDATARGGLYSVTRSFGPLEYRMVATGVAKPEFARGDDVRLHGDPGTVAREAGLAQAGYVTDVKEDREGEYSYTVHFPGRAGVQRGWTNWSLRKAELTPVALSSGEITCIRDAEQTLIERGARLKLSLDRSAPSGQREWSDFSTLSAGLAAMTGLEPDSLVRQLARRFGQRSWELGAGKQPKHPGTAAGAVTIPEQPGPRAEKRR